MNLTTTAIKTLLSKPHLHLCLFIEKPKVAFYAALTDAGLVGPYNVDVTLKFLKVYTNVGDAYNPSTGNESQKEQSHWIESLSYP